VKRESRCIQIGITENPSTSSISSHIQSIQLGRLQITDHPLCSLVDRQPESQSG